MGPKANFNVNVLQPFTKNMGILKNSTPHQSLLMYYWSSSNGIDATSGSAPWQEDSCKPKAISLPFKELTLSSHAEVRGISFGIGSPHVQQMSLLLRPALNGTYVYGGDGNCSLHKQECTTYRGGLFDRPQSRSAIKGDAIERVGDGIFANWTTDTVKISEQISLKEYEFGIRRGAQFPWITQGEIGLGINSAFLNVLQDAGKISSKVYSFFWGPETTIGSPEGSMTIGGYDSNLLDQNSSIKLPLRGGIGKCGEGMVVDITQITVEDEKGLNSTILSGGQKISACVAPQDRSILCLPKDRQDSIISAMGGIQLNESSNMPTSYYRSTLTSNSATFIGSVSITINDKLTVSFTHEQLLFGEPYVDSTGLVQHNNSRTSVPIDILPLDNDAIMPKIGGLFFSSAYLMVDHDAREFTLSRVHSNINATTPKLVGIDSANNCQEAIEIDSTPDSTPDSKDKSITASQIAGIIVGSIAGLALLAAAAFIVWKRRHKNVRDSEPFLSPDSDPQLFVGKFGQITRETELLDDTEVFEADSGGIVHLLELENRQRAVEVIGEMGVVARR
ncbi:hypothetical protein OPT61_g3537 [Boeremia exigua]|uniref:Uncharacterized protein n=1 Tax=Boeremia exigua TaxID=749465 RepID=A0ACC2IHL1_9PLEO|nr:hypothetical protein OPT61_g3537 [Boeremia exigua]